MSNKVLPRHRACLCPFDHKPFDASRGCTILCGQTHLEGLAQMRANTHMHRAPARNLHLSSHGTGPHGRFAPYHPHERPLLDRTGSLARYDITSTGIIWRIGRKELAWVAHGSQLQKVALPHGLVQRHVDFGNAYGAHPVSSSARSPAANLHTTVRASIHDGAYQLSTIVGALVAHHLVTRRRPEVRIGKVSVERPLQPRMASGCILIRRSAMRRQVVQLHTIRAHDGIHVIRSFEPALDLERCDTRVKQSG